ncbi:MAG: LysR family transcriptional regulator [Myxococcales bacterium]|jgi:DNA-binding transcriptional LysR family regulator|nr:LysR family transcriptional regulator [Myxococcales bacterium]
MSDVHDVLGALDLNLLRSLDALLTERHVTRAAARLGVTQSAASHALARLREEVGDLLLVRGPGGSLLPTPRAEQLGPVVRRALSDIAAAWREQEFVPGSARRTFTIGAGDFAELVLLPALAARLAATAPSVDLFVRVVPPEATAALASGQLDVVLAPTRDLGSGCFQRHLLDEVFTVAMRGGHAAATGKLTLDRYCALDHLLIAPRGSPGGFVDDALAKVGRKRRVAVTVPHFLIAPHVVAATELVMTVASRVATAFGKSHGLVTRPPPLELPGFVINLIWHERTQSDPAQRWFREQIIACAGRSRARGGARPLPPDALPELAQ